MCTPCGQLFGVIHVHVCVRVLLRRRPGLSMRRASHLGVVVVLLPGLDGCPCTVDPDMPLRRNWPVTAGILGVGSKAILQPAVGIYSYSKLNVIHKS